MPKKYRLSKYIDNPTLNDHNKVSLEASQASQCAQQAIVLITFAPKKVKVVRNLVFIFSDLEVGGWHCLLIHY